MQTDRETEVSDEGKWMHINNGGTQEILQYWLAEWADLTADVIKETWICICGGKVLRWYMHVAEKNLRHSTIYKELIRIYWGEVDFSIGLPYKNLQNVHLSPICVSTIYTCSKTTLSLGQAGFKVDLHICCHQEMHQDVTEVAEDTINWSCFAKCSFHCWLPWPWLHRA